MIIKNSTKMVFSVFNNLKTVINTQKRTGIDTLSELFEIQSDKVFNRLRSYTINICKSVYSDIENGYYSYNDFIIYCCYMSMFSDKKFSIFHIKKDKVKENRKLFTRDQYLEDKQMLKDIDVEMKLNKLEDYFTINPDGENIMYVLVMKKYLSPILYLQKYRMFLTNRGENNILTGKEFQRFEKLINIIFKTLKVEVCCNG